MAEARIPVLVVGGGPVGLVLALDLAQRGVPCLLANDGADTARHPQGNTHNSRTMEHYRRLGLAGPVRATGLPDDHVTDVAYFTRMNGEELSRLPMPTPAEKRRDPPRNPLSALTPEPIHRASQFYVEPVLKRRAETAPGLALRFGWRLAGFVDRGDAVEAELIEVATGRAETWRCSWLVGCDGGASTVRKQLGIRYEGQSGDEAVFMSGRMLSFYMRSPALAALVRARRAWQAYTMSPAARCGFVALDGQGDYAGLCRLPPGADEPAHTGRLIRVRHAGLQQRQLAKHGVRPEPLDQRQLRRSRQVRDQEIRQREPQGPQQRVSRADREREDREGVVGYPRRIQTRLGDDGRLRFPVSRRQQVGAPRGRVECTEKSHGPGSGDRPSPIITGP